MSRWKKVTAWAAALVAAVAIGGSGYVTRAEAHRMLTNPKATRRVSVRTPASEGLAFEDASVQSDGLTLRGWFVPGDTTRLILVQHGYKDRLDSMLHLTKLLHDHGYNVMVMCVRAHDRSDGESIAFGQREMPDMEAWANFAEHHAGVDPAKVGMFGVSMGGSLVVQYTATHQDVRALVVDSAFSSMDDTIRTSVKYFTGLPPFPFAPMMRFWAEREGGFKASDIDAKQWIGRVSPRPVLVMQGGADVVVSKTSGQLLFDAAREPKQFWYDPEVGHGKFLDMRPDEFEKRVVGFFDEYIR